VVNIVGNNHKEHLVQIANRITLTYIILKLSTVVASCIGMHRAFPFWSCTAFHKANEAATVIPANWTMSKSKDCALALLQK